MPALNRPPQYEDVIWGFDASSVQWTSKVSFLSAFEAGYRFAYVKCSQYSRTRDGRYSDLVLRLQAAGITVGAYHFCSHDSDPVSQMEFFFGASEGLGSNPGELPPMLDWEFCTPGHYTPANGFQDGHPAHCVNWLVKAQEHATRLWYPGNDRRELDGNSRREAVVYTYPNYSATHQPALGMALSLGTKPLVFASYTFGSDMPSRAHIPAHKIPAPWQKATMVQVKGNDGRLPGLVGACDIDCFLGSEKDWRVHLGY